MTVDYSGLVELRCALTTSVEMAFPTTERGSVDGINIVTLRLIILWQIVNVFHYVCMWI